MRSQVKTRQSWKDCRDLLTQYYVNDLETGAFEVDASEIVACARLEARQPDAILHCLDHGTQMGWLTDPEEEMIFVYLANCTIAIFDEPTQRLPVPDFASTVELTIGQIFSWLED